MNWPEREESLNSLKYVTYCGLYCRLCLDIARIPLQARALMKTLRLGHWDSFGETVVGGFDRFWEVLGKLSEFDRTIPGCRGGCGYPPCAIRKCAVARDAVTCAFCEDFPCDLVKEFSKTYPFILNNLREQREQSLELWIEKQEELYRDGYCFHDDLAERPEMV